MKYTVVRIGNIITQIAKSTDVIGYTEGILEVFLPETEGWSEKEISNWTKENNKRMQAICKFLNENDL